MKELVRGEIEHRHMRVVFAVAVVDAVAVGDADVVDAAAEVVVHLRDCW